MDPEFEDFFCLAIDTYCAFLQFYQNFSKYGNQELELHCWGSCLNDSCDIPAVFTHLNYNVMNDAQVKAGSDHVCAKVDLIYKIIQGNLFDQDDQTPIKQELNQFTNDFSGEDMAKLYIFKCWGGDRQGQSSMPNQYEWRVESFVTGDGYTCILGQSRGVKCQGRGYTGLKYWDTASIKDKQGVKQYQQKHKYLYQINEYPDTNYYQISAGGRNTCFIKGTTLSCTGNNWYNQLSIPAEHQNTSTVVESGWDYSCSVNTYHKIQCWGLNILGQTDTRILNKLSKIEGLISFHNVKTGLNHSCATYKVDYFMFNSKTKLVNKSKNKDKLQKLACWGGHNEFGQLDIPMKFQFNADNMLAVGDDHTCALNVQDQNKYSFDKFSREDVDKGVDEVVESMVDKVIGSLRGDDQNNNSDNDNDNDNENIANNSNSDELQVNHPIENQTDAQTSLDDFANRLVNEIINNVITNLEAESASAQPPTTTAQTIMSELACWGSNELGQMDLPRADWFGAQHSSFRRRKQRLHALEAGGAHSCSVELSQRDCWGSDSQGQRSIPAAVTDSTVASVALGAAHTCIVVIFDDRGELAHSLLCWGGVFDGYKRHQRGAGNGLDLWDTRDEGGDNRLIVPRVLSAGFEHNCLIGQDRRAECWGNDEDGDVNDV